MKEYVRKHLSGGLRQILYSSILLLIAAAILAASRLDAAAGITKPAPLFVAAKFGAYACYGAVGLAACWNIIVLGFAISALGGKSTPPASFVMLSMSARLTAIAGLAFCAYVSAPLPILIAGAVALIGRLCIKAP